MPLCAALHGNARPAQGFDVPLDGAAVHFELLRQFRRGDLFPLKKDRQNADQPIHFHGNHRPLFFCLYYTIGTGQLSVMFGFAGMFFYWKSPSIVLLCCPKHVMMVLSHRSVGKRKQSFRWHVFLLGNAAGGQQIFMEFRLRSVNEEQCVESRLLSRQNNADDGSHKGKGSHSDEQPFQRVKCHAENSSFRIGIIPYLVGTFPKIQNHKNRHDDRAQADE